MKVNFTLVVFLFFCLGALPGLSGKEIQKPKNTVNTKTDSIGVTKLDSISNSSICINGKLNAVSITKEPSIQKNLVDKQKNPSNTIDINGEGNSVTIHQHKNAGRVTIQQNGKGNQVNVSQTNSEE
jgi:hypothetical protein